MAQTVANALGVQNFCSGTIFYSMQTNPELSMAWRSVDQKSLLFFDFSGLIDIALWVLNHTHDPSALRTTLGFGHSFISVVS